MCTNNARLAVAAVLSNWHNVLRAINMASSELLPVLSSKHVTSDLSSYLAQAKR